MKYAVEVANTRSISKAAENLYTSQPNLSRAIKALENDLKIKIFKRSSKGLEITIDGEEFLLYAKNALKKIKKIDGELFPFSKICGIMVEPILYNEKVFALT